MPPKAKAVGQYRIQFHIGAVFGGDLFGLQFGVQFGHVGRCGDEIALHHQKAVDRFMHAGRAKAVPGQRFGR